MYLLLRGYFGLRGGFRPGWLLKNPALTLATCRAKPASIRSGPERNRKNNDLAAWTPAGPRKPAAVSTSGCLAFRGLTPREKRGAMVIHPP